MALVPRALAFCDIFEQPIAFNFESCSSLIMFIRYLSNSHYPNYIFFISSEASDLEQSSIPVQMKKCNMPYARE